MADQSDVETALVGAVGAALYPQGTAAPSVLGLVCRVYRGAPIPAALDKDLAAGVVNVTIFPDAAQQATTTRWPDEWKVTNPRLPELTAAVAGNAVTFGGTASPGQVAGVMVDNVAVVHRLEDGETPDSVAATLAAYLRTRRIVQLAGATLTVPGAGALVARVAADQVAMREIRRQRQAFRVSCWCADPLTRDRAAAAIDAALASRPFIGLADGTSGRLQFMASTVIDQTQNAALYRRDLVWSVEYATTATMTLPSMIFGDATMAPQGADIVRGVLS